MNVLSLSAIQKPLIIGHRGFRTRYPENTLASFQAALDAGADMIELDIRLSSDGHLVVIHDAEVERTTNGEGPVISYTLAELKQLDAGIWFHPRFVNERIPSLEEVLDLVRGRGLINIEIKVEPDHVFDANHTIEQKTVELIQRKRAETFSLVSSFNKKILENISQMDHPPAIGVLTEYDEKQDVVTLCKKLNALAWHPQYLAVDKNQVLLMHEAGIKILPYTVNSKEEIEQLFEMGVDGVFTDDPIMAIGCSGL